MILKKIFRCLVVIVICSMLLTAGCAREAKETAKPQVRPRPTAGEKKDFHTFAPPPRGRG